MTEVALWQWRWTNPGDQQDEESVERAGKWETVEPRNHLQTMEQRIEELRSYRFKNKPCYEVRALCVIPDGGVEVDRDTDGELLMDWSPGPGRMVTLSLRADGRLSYAFTWDGEKSHGTAQMPAGVRACQTDSRLVDCGECRTEGCPAGKCRNACIHHMDAGGDFHEFMQERARAFEQAQQAASGVGGPDHA